MNSDALYNKTLGSRLQNNRMPTVLKSVITADTFFPRKPRLKGCNNRKLLSAVKPQYRELK